MNAVMNGQASTNAKPFPTDRNPESPECFICEGLGVIPRRKPGTSYAGHLGEMEALEGIEPLCICIVGAHLPHYTKLHRLAYAADSVGSCANLAREALFGVLRPWDLLALFDEIAVLRSSVMSLTAIGSNAKFHEARAVALEVLALETGEFRRSRITPRP